MSARPPSISVARLAPIGASVVLLAACSGTVLPLGTDSPSQQVSPSEVSGALTACGASYAHPNVCCMAGRDDASTCFEYPFSPFTQCPSGTTTYPDPRACCALDGSGLCIGAGAGGGSVAVGSSSSSGSSSGIPAGGTFGSGSSGGTGGTGSSGGVGSSGAVSGGGSSGGGGATCSNPCPPGWYVPANVPVGQTACCMDGNGGTACSSSGSSSGSSGFSGSSGVSSSSGSSSGFPGSVASTASLCPTCPSGWQVPEGEPTLCCMTDPDGIIQCFSQAGVPAPTQGSGGPPSAGTFLGCVGGGGPNGEPFPCACQEQVAGHTYAVDCEPSTNVCTCSVDNGMGGATFADNGNTCGDYRALFQACGFPAN